MSRIPSDIVGKFQQQQNQTTATKESTDKTTVSNVQRSYATGSVIPFSADLEATKAEPPKPVVVDPSLPFAERPFKMHLMRAFLTQFDGSQHSQKLREEGAEHAWIG